MNTKYLRKFINNLGHCWGIFTGDNLISQKLKLVAIDTPDSKVEGDKGYMEAKIIEVGYKLNEPAPTCCSYCGEEKNFLLVKPTAMAFNGEIQVNLSMTKGTKWICLECLSLEIDAIGHSVDIHEYE